MDHVSLQESLDINRAAAVLASLLAVECVVVNYVLSPQFGIQLSNEVQQWDLHQDCTHPCQ